MTNIWRRVKEFAAILTVAFWALGLAGYWLQTKCVKAHVTTIYKIGEEVVTLNEESVYCGNPQALHGEVSPF